MHPDASDDPAPNETRAPTPAPAEPVPVARVGEVVPFFRVTDLARSLRFYVDGLGFRIERRWEPAGVLRWCSLRLGDAALMLQSFVCDDGSDLRPSEPLGTGVSLCLYCDDALAAYDALRARGVEAAEPFVGNGLWVVSLLDPDGYRIDLESPTDVAEDTTLTEHRAAPRDER